MKFIRLEILNLASLDREGGEVIDFEAGVLGQSNIFSIIGPTGSGKSTLLDAICLALYNCAPRYLRGKSKKGKEIKVYGDTEDSELNRLPPSNVCNILTRGKKSGYSKLTFLANNGNVYRAEWTVNKAIKNYTATTSLYLLTTDADGRPCEELAEWADLPIIIGQQYDQFIHTVLIAQGSFANFLKSNEDDRFKLLEQLIGSGETYRRITEQILVRYEAAKERYRDISASVQSFQSNRLDDTDLAALMAQIETLQKAVNELTERIETIKLQLKWYDDEEQLLSEISQQTFRFEEAQSALDAIQQAISRLALRDALLPAMQQMRELNRLKAAIAQADTELKRLTLECGTQQAVIQQANDLKSQLTQQAACAQQDIDAAHPHILRARELKAQLIPALSNQQERQKAAASAAKMQNEAQQKADRNARDIEQTQGEKQKQETALQALGESITGQREALAQAELAIVELLNAEQAKIEGQDAKLLQQQRESALQAVADLHLAIGIQCDLLAKEAELKQKSERQAELLTENAEISRQLATLTIEALTQEVNTLQEAYTLMTTEIWALHRTNLHDGDPCPLCGSTHHPYIAHPEQLDAALQNYRQNLQDKKDLLSLQIQQNTELNKQQSKNQGELNALQLTIDSLSKQISTDRERWQHLHSQHESWSEELEGLNAMLPAIEQADNEAAQALNLYNNTQAAIHQLTKQKDEAVQTLADFEKSSHNQLDKAKETLNETEKRLSGLLSNVAILHQQLQSYNQALTTAQQAEQEALQVVTLLQQALKAELGGNDPDAEDKRLKDAKAKADKALTDQVELIAQLEKKLGETQGQQAAKSEKLRQDQEEQYRVAEGLDLWLATYNTQHDAAIDHQTVSTLLFATDDWEAVRRDKEAKTEAVTTADALLKSANQRHQTHQTGKPQLPREELLKLRHELEQSTAQQELTEAELKLSKHRDAERQIGDLKEALDKAKLENDDWYSIKDAIGKDGTTLRKIAQCYTLRFLIEHANAEIRRFNRRYELQQVPNSLGIRVIDHDRGDDIRHITSLSGGETFIVSLGLALGLSSLSSRNNYCENLFIDEGFGTLDAETLSVVIDSLAMLQTSQGKKVGVISHTDTMSERITTQIRIIKNGNTGSSHIEIYP